MSKVYNPAYVMDVYYVVDTVTGQAAAVDFFRPADESSVMWLDACFSPKGELVVLGYGNVFGGEPAGAVRRDEPADVTALLVRIRDMECVPIEGLEFGTAWRYRST